MSEATGQNQRGGWQAKHAGVSLVFYILTVIQTHIILIFILLTKWLATYVLFALDLMKLYELIIQYKVITSLITR